MSYKMKKTIAVLLAAALGCNAAACSSDSSKSDVENTQNSETASTSEDGKIVTSQLDTADMFSDWDKEIGYDETQSVSIELADNGITATADTVGISDSAVTIKDEGTYILTGALSDGQVVVDADSKKVQLVLNGVDITSKSSATIYVKEADKVFITLADKSENKLTTSAEYVAIDDNNIDAVIFSKDDITLNGEGTLAVTSKAGNAITSSLYVNTDGDGIDSNGNMTINAGDIKVDGPSNSGNAAIDFGDGAKAYINGGSIIAVGGSGMVEAFDSSSKQAMMSIQVADSNITGEVVLSDSDGNVIISYTPAKEYNCVQISTAELEKGKTYTLKAGDTTTTIELNELLYSNISNNGYNGRGGKSFPRTT